jgi:phage recombination protein Bet
MSEQAAKTGHGATQFPQEKIDLLKRTVAVGCTDDELLLFLHIAERTGLDPFARQIHCVKRGNKMMVQTGIDGYRLIADRTGKYAGSDDYRFDDGLDEFQHIQRHRGNPCTATVTVYKLVDGVRCPFTATVRWDEYYPGRHQGYMWDKMPYLMLGKTAEALALRKAFPAELSGLYSDEEMAQAGETIDAETLANELEGKQTPVDKVAKPPRPLAPTVLREAMQRAIAGKSGSPDKNLLRKTSAALGNLTDNDMASRQTILNYLFGVKSDPELTAAMCEVLCKWIDSRKRKDGTWSPRRESAQEAVLILEAAKEAE